MEFVNSYNIPFEELDVSAGKVLKYIQGKNNSLAEFSYDFLDKFLKESSEFAEIRGGFVFIEPGRVNFSKTGFRIDDTEFNSERIITSRLRKSDSAAILVATAGKYYEDHSKKLMSEGDVFHGYLVDAAASEIAEAAIEWVEQRIDEFAAARLLRTTSRYSPGYCGWWVGEQHKLFSFLPAGFCGIKLTDSSLMLPVKSVSAIIGIGAGVEKEEYECAICEEENCFRRNL
jgi:hypothetical protein